MATMEELKFTKTHEWVLAVDAGVKVGLTEHAQEQLGDIVFMDLPATGDKVTMGESFADVESVKAVSEVYAPVTGTVASVNGDLEAAPELINRTPYDTWLIEVTEISREEELLSFEAYQKFCAEEA